MNKSTNPHNRVDDSPHFNNQYRYKLYYASYLIQIRQRRHFTIRAGPVGLLIVNISYIEYNKIQSITNNTFYYNSHLKIIQEGLSMF